MTLSVPSMGSGSGSVGPMIACQAERRVRAQNGPIQPEAGSELPLGADPRRADQLIVYATVTVTSSCSLVGLLGPLPPGTGGMMVVPPPEGAVPGASLTPIGMA